MFRTSGLSAGAQVNDLHAWRYRTTNDKQSALPLIIRSINLCDHSSDNASSDYSPELDRSTMHITIDSSVKTRGSTQWRGSQQLIPFNNKRARLVENWSKSCFSIAKSHHEGARRTFCGRDVPEDGGDQSQLHVKLCTCHRVTAALGKVGTFMYLYFHSSM